MCQEREREILFQRAQSLVCGVFSHADGPDDQPVFRVSGSGLFVAPFMALSARHVVQDLKEAVPGRADDLRRRQGYFTPPFWSGLFQVDDNNRAPVLWAVRRTWEEPLTDIAVLEVAADQGAALERQYKMPVGFPEWSLLPPVIGSPVMMIGFPQAHVAGTEQGVGFRGPYELVESEVLEVFDEAHDEGMYSFPCFSVRAPVDHGFSGGPVFCGGRLCGLVSGGGFDGASTFVASLWPLLLTEADYPDLGPVLGRPTGMANLFERGVLRSPDWPDVRGRVTDRIDDRGRRRAGLKR